MNKLGFIKKNMKDNESIFKEIIKNQLVEIGYKKEEEWKGFLKYRCQNNYGWMMKNY